MVGPAPAAMSGSTHWGRIRGREIALGGRVQLAIEYSRFSEPHWVEDTTFLILVVLNRVSVRKFLGGIEGR